MTQTIGPATAAGRRVRLRRRGFLGSRRRTARRLASRLGRRLDTSAIRRRYKRAADAAGLRLVKLHGLRHAAGSVLARTLPPVTVRDVLGHAELATTNRYLHSKIDAAAIVAVNAAFGVEPDQPASKHQAM